MTDSSLCLPGENWKAIPDFPGYEVSDMGRVRSYHRRCGSYGQWEIAGEPQRILKAVISGQGYLYVLLSRDSVRYNRKVHRLVAEAFVGPRPEGQECCHNDGDPSNNRASNLRYDTHYGNVQDAVAHGAHEHMSDFWAEETVIEIRRRFADGAHAETLAKEHKCSSGHVRCIAAGTTYPAYGGPLTKNRNRKLTRAIALCIRQAVREHGESQKSQALKYNCSPSMISRIISGERYPERREND
jgi:hypothetical protein